MPQISRLEVIATGARRRWTPEAKQRIIAESFAVPRNVSATARRHRMSTSQLFTWRRQAREGKLAMTDDGAAFIPAVVTRERSIPRSTAAGGPENFAGQSGRPTAAAGRMEIVLADAQRIIVGSDVDAEALARVIEALERR